MPLLKLDVKSDNLTTNDLDIFVNDQQIVYRVTNSSIEIDHCVSYGLHKLTAISKSSKQIEITAIHLNGCNIQELKYLATIKDNAGNVHQPATIFWGEVGLEYTLHFVYPLSRWIDVNSKKFLRSDIPGDLSQKYHIYYPDSIKVDRDDVPQAVKDFYAENFDFTVIPKDNFELNDVPFMRYNKIIPQDIIDRIAVELKTNFEFLKQQSGIKKSIDSAGNTTDNSWKLYWLIKPGGQVSSELVRFPAITQMLEFLGIESFYLFIGTLPPGGYIYPHCDNYEHNITGHEKYDGCCQIYIPVIWPKGCSLKMANAGLVPMDNGPMIINSDFVSHAGLNLSNEYRFVLGLRTSRDEILKNGEFI